MSDRIEVSAQAMWAVRRRTFESVGARDIGEWEDQPVACRESVRREAEAAITAVELLPACAEGGVK